MIAVRHTCDEATDGAACLLAEGRSDSVFGLPGTGEGDDTAMVELFTIGSAIHRMKPGACHSHRSRRPSSW